MKYVTLKNPKAYEGLLEHGHIYEVDKVIGETVYFVGDWNQYNIKNFKEVDLGSIIIK